MYTVIVFNADGRLKHIKQYGEKNLMRAEMSNWMIGEPDWLFLVFKNAEIQLYKGRDQLSMF